MAVTDRDAVDIRVQVFGGCRFFIHLGKCQGAHGEGRFSVVRNPRTVFQRGCATAQRARVSVAPGLRHPLRHQRRGSGHASGRLTPQGRDAAQAHTCLRAPMCLPWCLFGCLAHCKPFSPLLLLNFKFFAYWNCSSLRIFRVLGLYRARARGLSLMLLTLPFAERKVLISKSGFFLSPFTHHAFGVVFKKSSLCPGSPRCSSFIVPFRSMVHFEVLCMKGLRSGPTLCFRTRLPRAPL